MEYIPPLEALGTDYTTFPTEHGESSYGYRVKVIASEDSTFVSVPSEGHNTVIDFGDVFDFVYSDLRSAVTIHCSAPCMAVQYINTARQSGSTTRTLGSFMIVLIPDSQFVDDVIFNTPLFLTTESSSVAALSIVTDYEPTDGPYLNGADLSTLNWQSTADGLKYYATLEISAGFYTLDSTQETDRYS